MIKNTTSYLSVLFSIVLFAPLTPVYGETSTDTQEQELREYDVEIIIFEDAHARYMYSESWEPKAVTTDEESPEDNQEIAQATELERNFSPLPVGMLDNQYRRLGLSSEVKVLYRTAWRQAGLDKTKAFSISLDELQNQHKSTSDNNVTGTIRLVLARYLHLYADIVYHRPLSNPASPDENASAQAGITDFELHVHRKMRSKELHYIDHPLIGMLVKIMPVEKPEESQKESPENS